jgi:type IV pilus assembly protein PilP
MTRAITCICFGLLLAASAAAQTPAPTPAPTAVAKPAEVQPPAPAAAQPAGYTYDPAGRRDPFVSLLNRGSDLRGSGSRPPGVPGFLVNEVSIKGILKDRTGFVAMIQGTDNKTYVIRTGDKLLDGAVKSIVPDAVLFAQDVNDPLSLVKQREIRKPLRPNQEGR